MKTHEIDYLNKLFATSASNTSSIEPRDTEFPLVDLPEGLSSRLYAIADTSPQESLTFIQRIFRPGPVLSGVAVSLLAAVMVFQTYQQNQTLQQLEQAQADLATALQYLNEANQIARVQVLSTLNNNMKKAAVEPTIEIGREAVLPPLKELEEKSDTPNRTL